MGGGEGGVRGAGSGSGVGFSLRVPGRGSPGGGGGMGPGGCLRRIGEMVGGGGAKYFFGAEMSTKICWFGKECLVDLLDFQLFFCSF